MVCVECVEAWKDEGQWGGLAISACLRYTKDFKDALNTNMYLYTPLTPWLYELSWEENAPLKQ